MKYGVGICYQFISGNSFRAYAIISEKYSGRTSFQPTPTEVPLTYQNPIKFRAKNYQNLLPKIVHIYILLK